MSWGAFPSLALLGGEGGQGDFAVGLAAMGVVAGIVGAALVNGAEAARMVLPPVFLSCV